MTQAVNNITQTMSFIGATGVSYTNLHAWFCIGTTELSRVCKDLWLVDLQAISTGRRFYL